MAVEMFAKQIYRRCFRQIVTGRQKDISLSACFKQITDDYPECKSGCEVRISCSTHPRNANKLWYLYVLGNNRDVSSCTRRTVVQILSDLVMGTRVEALHCNLHALNYISVTQSRRLHNTQDPEVYVLSRELVCLVVTIHGSGRSALCYTSCASVLSLS